MRCFWHLFCRFFCEFDEKVLDNLSLEAVFYEWLLSTLSEKEREAFLATLDTLYLRAKQESRAGFPTVRMLVAGDEG